MAAGCASNADRRGGNGFLSKHWTQVRSCAHVRGEGIARRNAAKSIPRMAKISSAIATSPNAGNGRKTVSS